MGKNIKKLTAYQTTTLEKFLEFNPKKPEDVVAFHKHKLLLQLGEYMLKNNITKAALAKDMGISRQAVTNKFLGETLTLDWIVRAFAVLGVGLEMKKSSQYSLAV